MSLEAAPSAAAPSPLLDLLDSESLKRKASDPSTPVPALKNEEAGNAELNDLSSSAFKVSRYQALAAVGTDVVDVKPVVESTKPDEEDKYIARDAFVFQSSKGYHTKQAKLSASNGSWYFEVVIAKLGESGHCRLGWNKRLVETDVPVGADTSGWGYCDVGGEKVHDGRREAYGDAFAAGDVIGCYISMHGEELTNVDGENETKATETTPSADPETQVEKGSADAANAGVVGTTTANETNPVVEKEDVTEDVTDKPVETLDEKESEKDFGFVGFVKNGVLQGDAFRIKERGAFYPSVSLYTQGSGDSEPAKVGFNFGPEFLFPVSDFGEWERPRPMCEATIDAKKK